MSNIEFITYKKDEYKTKNWSGGTTTELGIYPKNSSYEERKFIWRLSSANVENEESDFTFLPEYDRVLIVLEGEVVLVHKETRVARLTKYEQDRFSGGYETKSYGKITDFNLMIQKGNKGFAEAITMTKEYSLLRIEEVDEYSKISQGFYCAEGFCVVNVNKESYMLKEGELLIVNCNYDEIKEIGIMGEGKTIRTHVYFNENAIDNNQDEKYKDNDQELEITQETIKSKITFEDVKVASLLCWSNFRGSKYIFKSLKDVWYDEALQKGIDKIERLFLPALVCMIGMGGVTFIAWEHLQKPLVALAIILWLLIDIIIINPLMYLLALPKPIKPHIKKIVDLTETEKTAYDQQTNENKMADKILKKYEITGRNKYID